MRFASILISIAHSDCLITALGIGLVAVVWRWAKGRAGGYWSSSTRVFSLPFSSILSRVNDF